MKIFLPTELGVKGEGSNSTINDKHTPDVKEIDANEDPSQKEQPEFYKRIRNIEDHDLTLAEEAAGVDNTRNQADYDKSPKEGKADEARKPADAGLVKKPASDTKTADKK